MLHYPLFIVSGKNNIQLINLWVPDLQDPQKNQLKEKKIILIKQPKK